MRQHSRTDLCGGRPETVVPTATSALDPPRDLPRPEVVRSFQSEGEGKLVERAAQNASRTANGPIRENRWCRKQIFTEDSTPLRLLANAGCFEFLHCVRHCGLGESPWIWPAN